MHGPLRAKSTVVRGCDVSASTRASGWWVGGDVASGPARVVITAPLPGLCRELVMQCGPVSLHDRITYNASAAQD